MPSNAARTGWLSPLLLGSALAAAAPAAVPAPKPRESSPPSIAAILKPAVHKRVVDDRDVMTSASLDKVEGSGDPPLKRYAFYAGMLVRASPRLTHAVLTDYKAYAKLVKYVDKAEYDERAKELRIEGGIWSYKLVSWLKFEDVSPGWLRWRIVRGSFTGLRGDVLIEPRGEQDSVVLMRGEGEGRAWPPALIVEQGARIVFGFTGDKMRGYIEERKKTGDIADAGPGKPSPTPSGFPQPRARLH